MGTFKLKDGDFGVGIEVTIGANDVYLPMPGHLTQTHPVPLTEFVEVERVEPTNTDKVMEVAQAGLVGLAAIGPVGLAVGVANARKPKEVTFTAVTDPGTFADFRSELRNLHTAHVYEDARADNIIAKYLNEPSRGRVEESMPPPPPEAPVRATRTAGAAQPVFGRRGR